MRLDAFLLAEAAYASPDGRLFVHAAGMTRISAPALPFTQPALSVVLRLAVEDDAELLAPHEFRFSLSDPAGRAVLPSVKLRFEPNEPPLLAEGEERFVQLALSFGSVTFAHTGVHRIEAMLDGEVLRTMSLPVVTPSAQTA